MNRQKKGMRLTKPDVDVDPATDAALRTTPDDVALLDEETRAALSIQLHELLNSLWPAAVRIELAMSEEFCPATFRETLEQLGCCIEEAMTIAAQASTLLNSPAGKCDPS